MKLLTASTLAFLLHLGMPCSAENLHSGIHSPSLDPTVRVQDDLFLAANGNWLRTTAIPDDKSYVIGVEVNDLTDGRIRTLVEGLAARPQRPGSLEQKIGAFYASYMDTAAIDRAGLAPLRAMLAQVDAVRSVSELAALQGRSQEMFETPVWLRVFPDLKDPGVNRVMTWQGGLGLPDRSYYLPGAGARMESAAAAYRHYLATLARLAGMAAPDRVASTVYDIEQRIAATHWPANRRL